MVQYIWSSKTHFKMSATILYQLPRIILGNIPSEIIIERKVSRIPGVSTICIFPLGALNTLNKELPCYPQRPDHAQIPWTFQTQISTKLSIPVTHQILDSTIFMLLKGITPYLQTSSLCQNWGVSQHSHAHPWNSSPCLPIQSHLQMNPNETSQPCTVPPGFYSCANACCH